MPRSATLFLTGLLGLGALGLAPPAAATQAPREFAARLSTVPIDEAMQTTVAGSGRATASLSGSRLSIAGSFEGLRSPATTAHLHIAPLGLRGPAVFDLQVTPDTKGSISGAVDLSAAQVEDLGKRRFYIQLHSEQAPEGNLRGWLLPRETRR